jgi:hypothetical protein
MKAEEKNPMTQDAANRHVRQIHYLLQWLVGIALLQLLVLGYFAYKVIDLLQG